MCNRNVSFFSFFFLFFFKNEKKKSSMASILLVEILTEILKCIKDDYKTLFSCILVNRKWHSISIPILWRNPLYTISSARIIVNCLLAMKDKDFLIKNSIELPFKLLDRPPLYNYAKFTTVLEI